MNRYYFHIHNGDGLTRDEEGYDLLDDDAARQHAIDAAAAIVADELKGGCEVVRLTVTIEHRERGVLSTIPVMAEIGQAY